MELADPNRFLLVNAKNLCFIFATAQLTFKLDHTKYGLCRKSYNALSSQELVLLSLSLYNICSVKHQRN